MEAVQTISTENRIDPGMNLSKLMMVESYWLTYGLRKGLLLNIKEG